MIKQNIIAFQPTRTLNFILLLATACCGLFIVYRLTAPTAITWKHGGVDGAELMLASHFFGIAHPPGYPFYTFLGWIAQQIPVGNPFQRMLLFSNFTALMAVGLLAYLSWHFTQHGIVTVSALLFLGLTFTFWTQAIIVEVYLLLTVFFLAGLVLCLIRPGTRWTWLSMGHILGLAVAHHLTTLLWLPGFLVLFWGRGRNAYAYFLLGIVSGGYPFLFLLLRAGQNPAANWGGIESGLTALWEHISAKIYQPYLSPPSLDLFLGGITTWLAHISTEISIVGVIVALIGIVRFIRLRHYRFLAAVLLWIVLLSGFTGLYEADDTINVYTLPLLALSTLLIAVGGAWIVGDRRVSAVLPAAVLMVAVSVQWMKVDIHTDTEPREYVDQAFALLPADSIIITSSTHSTFTLWYYHFVEGMRPDVIILDRHLWRFDWYRHNLKRLYPDLPEPTVPLEQWIRSPVFSQRTIASDFLLAQTAGRRVNRVGDWYVSTRP